MTCPICGREPVQTSELCSYHARAERNLLKGYEKWKVAYGGIVWTTYLDRIESLEGTGQWIREVAVYLRSKG